MKSHDLQTGRTNAHLNRRGNYVDFSVELVTDDLLQVYAVLPVSPSRVDNLPWILAHLVDAVALEVERLTGVPFRATTVVFTAAWDMVNSRGTSKRKESARDLALPPFLGGSEDPPVE